MNHVSVRRSAGTAGLAAATATAIALSPLTIPAVNQSALQHHSVQLVTIEAIQLTDAWSDLIASSTNSLQALVQFSGVGLPAVSNPIAPIAEQVAINLLTYGGQLLSGQGGLIPGEIQSHVGKVGQVVQQLIAAIPTYVQQVIANQSTAVALAVQAFTANPLTGLIEAPAVFLNQEINGIGGLFTVLQVAVGTRNATALALDPPLPSWLSWLKPATVSPKTPVSVGSTPKTKAVEAVLPKGSGSPAKPVSEATGPQHKGTEHNTSEGASTKPGNHPSTPHTPKHKS